MKRILVILLALLVAGGVFAQQGTWSIGGSVEIGTHIDFDPIPGDKDTMAEVGGTAYHPTWDNIRGILNLTYSRDAATLGLILRTPDPWGPADRAFVAFSGENYNAKAQINGLAITGATPTVHQLFGEYKMVNGMVGLDVAYRSNAREFWASDKSANIDGYAYESGTPLRSILTRAARPTYGANSGNWKGTVKSQLLFASTETYAFASPDQNTSYIRPYVDIANINFGIMIPNVFADGRVQWVDGLVPNTGNDRGTELTDVTNKGNRLFVEDSLKNSIFGVKFDMHPIEFAAQFKFRDYAVYFGARFNTGPVTFGLSFKGELNPEEEDGAKGLGIGANVDYDAGAFGASVKGFLNRHKDDNSLSAYTQIIGIQPSLFYKIIPSHLGFNLTTGFYFTDMKLDDGTTSVDGQPDVIWAVEPQLFWNFLGTGAATGYWSMGTGMHIRYRMISEFNVWDPPAGATDATGLKNAANFLDVIFRWTF